MKPPRVSVEPRGVEPLSEDQTTRASPSAVCVLTFPLPNSRRQDSGFSSFIKSRRPQSLRRLVPCYYDADGLRRRRLRVDDRRLGGESYVIVVVSSFKFPLLGGSGPPLTSLSLRMPAETKIRPRVGTSKTMLCRKHVLRETLKTRVPISTQAAKQGFSKSPCGEE